MSCGLTLLLLPDSPLCLEHTGDGRTESVLNCHKTSFLTISVKHEMQVYAVLTTPRDYANSGTHASFNKTMLWAYTGFHIATYPDHPQGKK